MQDVRLAGGQDLVTASAHVNGASHLTILDREKAHRSQLEVTEFNGHALYTLVILLMQKDWWAGEENLVHTLVALVRAAEVTLLHVQNRHGSRPNDVVVELDDRGVLVELLLQDVPALPEENELSVLRVRAVHSDAVSFLQSTRTNEQINQ